MLTILQSIHDDHIAAGHGSGTPARGHRPVLPRHLRREGVWKKLDSLYDLSALDEREEAYRHTGPQFRRGRDGVAREVISGSDNEDSDIMESAEERSFSLLGQGDDVDSERWEGIHDTISASRDPEEREIARMMWNRRLRDHEDNAGESSSEEFAEDMEADAGTQGQDNDDDDDDGDAKLRLRATRRASTRHAAASTPAASSPGAEEPGDEDEDGGDEGGSKPDSSAKATRSSTRTASGRATRKK
jgi:MRG-binding protein